MLVIAGGVDTTDSEQVRSFISKHVLLQSGLIVYECVLSIRTKLSIRLNMGWPPRFKELLHICYYCFKISPLNNNLVHLEF